MIILKKIQSRKKSKVAAGGTCVTTLEKLLKDLRKNSWEFEKVFSDEEISWKISDEIPEEIYVSEE